MKMLQVLLLIKIIYSKTISKLMTFLVIQSFKNTKFFVLKFTEHIYTPGKGSLPLFQGLIWKLRNIAY